MFRFACPGFFCGNVNCFYLVTCDCSKKPASHWSRATVDSNPVGLSNRRMTSVLFPFLFPCDICDN
jgi:hypothetical protein